MKFNAVGKGFHLHCQFCHECSGYEGVHPGNSYSRGAAIKKGGNWLKRYVALVEGRMPQEEQTLKMPQLKGRVSISLCLEPLLDWLCYATTHTGLNPWI